MPSSSVFRAFLIFMLCMLPGVALAALGDKASLVSDIEQKFNAFGQVNSDLSSQFLDVATHLFWTLAAMSLVWTMGMQVVRQDLGEVLMELTRFVVVTGIFYWLLINASVANGKANFVVDVLNSFFQLSVRDSHSRTFMDQANELGRIGVELYNRVVTATTYADIGDKLFGNLIAAATLIVLVVMAAQFLLVLIVAWLLSFGGIFLLGFGGARWTTPIAISFYKHVLAIGMVAMALGFIGSVGTLYLGQVTQLTQHARSGIANFERLGIVLSISILMLVLSLRVPQILYSVVTGSQLGLYAGSAGMVGSAIGTGGMAAMASMSGWAQQIAQAARRTETEQRASVRTESVMDAVQRSAVGMSSMPEAFHTQVPAQPGASVHRPLGGTPTGGGVFRQVSPRTASAELAQASPGSAERFGNAWDAGGEKVSSRASRSDAVVRSLSRNVAGATEPLRPDYEAEMSAIAASRQQPAASASVPSLGTASEAGVGMVDTAHLDHASQDDVSGHDVSRTVATSTDSRRIGAIAHTSHAVDMPAMDAHDQGGASGLREASVPNAGISVASRRSGMDATQDAARLDTHAGLVAGSMTQTRDLAVETMERAVSSSSRDATLEVASSIATLGATGGHETAIGETSSMTRQEPTMDTSVATTGHGIQAAARADVDTMSPTQDTHHASPDSDVLTRGMREVIADVPTLHDDVGVEMAESSIHVSPSALPGVDAAPPGMPDVATPTLENRAAGPLHGPDRAGSQAVHSSAAFEAIGEVIDGPAVTVASADSPSPPSPVHMDAPAPDALHVDMPDIHAGVDAYASAPDRIDASIDDIDGGQPS